MFVIALAKGRLLEPSLELLSRAGIRFAEDATGSRKLIFDSEDGRHRIVTDRVLRQEGQQARIAEVVAALEAHMPPGQVRMFVEEPRQGIDVPGGGPPVGRGHKGGQRIVPDDPLEGAEDGVLGRQGVRLCSSPFSRARGARSY